MILIYTDGSTLNNQDSNLRRSGCAFLININNKNIYLYGCYLENETNNYAELMAVKKSLSWVIAKLKLIEKHNDSYNIVFRVDSKYVLGIFENGNKYKINVELIEKIKKQIDYLTEKGYNISFKHVKAHTNKKDSESEANKLVDEIARECAKSGKDIKRVINKLDE